MAIALINSGTITGSGGGNIFLDTTGATLIVIVTSSYSGGVAPTPGDGGLNTFTALTVRTTGNIRHSISYCVNPTTYPSHFLNSSGVGSYIAAFVYVFSGVASYHSQSGTTGTSLTTLASGSVTPSINGALILTGTGGDSTVTDSISPVGFTLTTLPFTGGTNMQGSAAWQIQTTAAAINPTWSYSPAQTGIAVGTAVFLPTVVSSSAESISFSVVRPD